MARSGSRTLSPWQVLIHMQIAADWISVTSAQNLQKTSPVYDILKSMGLWVVLSEQELDLVVEARLISTACTLEAL